MSANLHRKLAAWAANHSSVQALHVFGSRARGDASFNSDLDIAFDLESRHGNDLSELIVNAPQWKAELTKLTGVLVKDLYLRRDLQPDETIVTVFRR